MPEPALSPAQPLGRSLELDQGDLVVTSRADAPGRATLAMVEGVDALAQAITVTLQTQLGSDPLNVTHGFDALAIGESPYGVRTRKEFLKLHLVRAVGGDRRVKDVRELFFDDDPRFFELHPELDPDVQRRRVRASRRFTVTVVLETAGGELVEVRAGGLGA